ncbi:UPF0651 protein, mitochondrial [Melia azedarach]|uniref:UPF0651 protein, mitochondrial n=1 Tax=Melia azedarach TaxID=155640 RepID=A0ACC1XS26_MELAZ|nr:UPF0651 protein, mitochondrial [Melia azedarach]
METAAYCHRASSLANHIRTKPKDVLTDVVVAMRLRPDLTLKRLSVSDKKFQNSRIFCVNAIPEQMESKSKEENIKKREEEEEEKQQQESKKTLPPPPEKPEPGDCCGSGCVRCVWDVYYEELEAYNELYKSDYSSNNKSNSDRP